MCRIFTRITNMHKHIFKKTILLLLELKNNTIILIFSPRKTLHSSNH